MPKMSDNDLLGVIEAARQDAMIFNGEFSQENERYLREYLGRPYGDEEPDPPMEQARRPGESGTKGNT